MSYELIETVDLGGSSSVSISSIPQDGTDLVLKISMRGSGTTAGLRFNFSTSGYPYDQLFGNGTSVSANAFSFSEFLINQNDTAWTSNTFTSNEIYVYNYTAGGDTAVMFTMVSENNGTAAHQRYAAGNYQTFAVNSLQINSFSGTFATNSTASLYKITAA